MNKSLLAILLTVTFATSATASEFKNWYCVTDKENLVLMYEQDGDVMLRIDRKDAGTTLVGTVYKEDKVTRGYMTYPRGEVTYVRFSSEYDFVVLNGEVGSNLYQGAKVFKDGTLIEDHKCTGYVSTQILDHPKLGEETEENFDIYGEI